jgi:hypothetical protein
VLLNSCPATGEAIGGVRKGCEQNSSWGDPVLREAIRVDEKCKPRAAAAKRWSFGRKIQNLWERGRTPPTFHGLS